MIKTRHRLAKWQGLNLLFCHRLTALRIKSETVNFKAVGRASMNRKIFLSAVVQIVDTTTGQLLPESPSVQLTKSEEVENARIGQATGSDQIIVRPCKGNGSETFTGNYSVA